MKHHHGCYTIHWEESFLYIRQVGPSTAADLLWAAELMSAQANQTGPLDLLIDLSEAGLVSAEARREFSQHPVNRQMRAVAIFGMSVALRALVTLLVRAAFLISKAPIQLAFFGTEEEARAWLRHQRASRERG